MEETFAHLGEQYPDPEDFNTHVNTYLTMQKDLIQLATAGILAGRGMDVDTAIVVSDNALTHNWMETALENAAHHATDLALENPENLEEIKQHILDEVPLEALENLSAWVEANPDKVAAGVSVFMGAMDRNAEDRGAPLKDSKAQRRAKEKILTKAITQSPALLKDILAKVKGGGAQGVAAKKGVEKVAVQLGAKDVTQDGERIRKRAHQRNIVPIAEDHLVEGREWREKIIRNPASIQDKMTLDAAKKGAGDIIPINLKNPKYKGMEKWEYKVKSKDGKDSVVHYIRDPKTGELMDFKFKKRSID